MPVVPSGVCTQALCLTQTNTCRLKHNRIDIAGYFPFFAANVSIIFRKRYLHHIIPCRRTFAKLLHTRSLMHQKRSSPLLPPEIVEKIADLFAGLYWDENDPTIALRAVGIPHHSRWPLIVHTK